MSGIRYLQTLIMSLVLCAQSQRQTPRETIPLQFPSNLPKVPDLESQRKEPPDLPGSTQGPEETKHLSCFPCVLSRPATDTARVAAAIVLFPPATALQLGLSLGKKGTSSFHV